MTRPLHNNGVKVVPSYLLEAKTIYTDNLKESSSTWLLHLPTLMRAS